MPLLRSSSKNINHSYKYIAPPELNNKISVQKKPPLPHQRIHRSSTTKFLFKRNRRLRTNESIGAQQQNFCSTETAASAPTNPSEAQQQNFCSTETAASAPTNLSELNNKISVQKKPPPPHQRIHPQPCSRNIIITAGFHASHVCR